MRRAIVITLGIILGALHVVHSVDIAAAAPAIVTAPNGTPQSTAVNEIFQVALVAWVRDANTNPVPNVTVTFAAPATGPSATFNGSTVSTVVTDGSGLARAPTLTANGQSGSYTVTASVSGVAIPAIYSLTNTGGVTSPGTRPPTNLRIIGGLSSGGTPSSVGAFAGTPQSATVNTAFGSLKAIVRDASASPLAGINVTFTAPTSGVGGTFGGATTATAVTDNSGVATSPPLTADGATGSYVVTAFVAGVATPAIFSLTNILGSGGGGVGVWTNVTPSTFSLNPSDFGNDNFGVQDIVVDPVRPSDLYASSTHQGLLKSTDYGLTWRKINTGANGSLINGKMWTLGIDPNRSRNPASAPTLYTTNFGGTGGMGLWKSVTGGVDWTRCGNTPMASQDVYTVDIDPYDSQHLIIGFHEEAGLAESSDGCATWRKITAAPSSIISVYPFFIDTGDAATTRGTWLLMGQASGATYRTADQGATFAQVNPLGHLHGCAQIFQAGGGVIYMAGAYGSQGNGIYRSTDYGVSWTRVNDGAVQNGIVGTPTYMYATYGWASGGVVPQALQRSPRGSGTTWSTYMPTPAGFTNGAKRAAVTFDGSRYIIVSGNWLAGFWRYVE